MGWTCDDERNGGESVAYSDVSSFLFTVLSMRV